MRDFSLCCNLYVGSPHQLPDDISKRIMTLVTLAGRRGSTCQVHGAASAIAAAHADAPSAGRQLDRMRECGNLFVEGSADFFFVTPALWRRWRRSGSIPEFVLGGVGADNYFIHLAAETEGVVSVDASKTATCVHQEHENVSHERQNSKSAFNRGLMRLPWKTDGSMHSLKFYTDRDELTQDVVVRKRS